MPPPGAPRSAPAADGAGDTAPAIHLSPITAKSRRLAYKGPIYQKTATGEVVPYVPPAPAAAADERDRRQPDGGATTAAATANGLTQDDAATPQPELLVPGSLARYVNGFAAAPMSAPANRSSR